MADLQDGESVEIQGSAAKPYIIKNVGGVFSCNCPARRNQPSIERSPNTAPMVGALCGVRTAGTSATSFHRILPNGIWAGQSNALS